MEMAVYSINGGLCVHKAAGCKQVPQSTKNSHIIINIVYFNIQYNLHIYLQTLRSLLFLCLTFCGCHFLHMSCTSI